MTRSFSNWRQFSLRTFLLLVTAFCLIFGWWASQSLRQREAVAALQQLGASVEYDDHSRYARRYRLVQSGRTFRRQVIPPAQRSWLRQLMGDDWFAHVTNVAMRGGAVTNEVLKKAAPHLARLQGLQQLDLSHAQIDAKGLRPLEVVEQLQQLRLYQTKIVFDDSELVELRRRLPNLQFAY
jgi:hypothetical protein